MTRRGLLLAAMLFAAGCTFIGGADPSATTGPGSGTPAAGPAAAAADGGGPGARDGENLVPAGYGTLRQGEVTFELVHGDLLIQITPLAPGIIRLTAPDTYQRLRELRDGHGPDLARRSGMADPTLFLVAFFSYEQEIAFQPEDLHLLNGGLRFRPAGIQPITPGWGTQRLAQEETQMAVYAFDRAVNLGRDLMVEYQDVRRGGWEQILQRIQGERTRVLARARAEG